MKKNSQETNPLDSDKVYQSSFETGSRPDKIDTGLKDKNGKNIYVGDTLTIIRSYSDTSKDPWGVIKKEETTTVKGNSWSCGCCHNVYGFSFGHFDDFDIANCEVKE